MISCSMKVWPSLRNHFGIWEVTTHRFRKNQLVISFIHPAKTLIPMHTRFCQKNTTYCYVSAPHPGLQPRRVWDLRASGATPGEGTAAGGGPRLPPRHVRCQVGPYLHACMRCSCDPNSSSFQRGQLTCQWFLMRHACSSGEKAAKNHRKMEKQRELFGSL